MRKTRNGKGRVDPNKTSVWMALTVCVCLCPPVRLSVLVYLCMSVSLYVCLCMPFCLCLFIFACMSHCMSVCACLSVHVCLSVIVPVSLSLSHYLWLSASKDS